MKLSCIPQTENDDKDYRLKVSLRNAKFLRVVEGKGFKSLSDACRKLGLSISDYGDLAAIVALARSPLSRTSNAEFRPVVLRFCAAINVDPWDLFSVDQVLMEFDGKSKSKSVDTSAAECLSLVQAGRFLVANENADGQLMLEEKNRIVNDVLKTCTPKEEEVIHARFGIGRSTSESLDEKELTEIAHTHNVSCERIRQIESKALRKLREPSRAKRLKPLL